jgi:hypothetical protein
MGLLLPTGPQSVPAIIAGYAGLLGIIPGVSLLALICGVLGIVDVNAHPEKRGMGRAITGIIGGLIFSVVWVLILANR